MKINTLFKNGRLSNYILMGVLSIIAAIQLYPLWWLVMFSLKSDLEIEGRNVMGLPYKPLFENYSSAWNQAHISTYLLNSVLVTATSILLCMILSTMASYAISRMTWKLSRPVLLLFLTGLMIPLNACLFPLMLILKNLKLLNSYWSLIIPYTGFGMPMAIFVISGFFRGLPKEMEESACIDGAGIFRIFFSIMLPLVKPAIATCMVFTYLSCWNELMFAVTYINDDRLRTLTVGIMSMVGQYTTHWGPIGAGLVIVTLPTLIIYVFLSKQIQQSFTAGAIKG